MYESTKFDSAITEYAYDVSLDGGPDEETGEAQYSGWYGIMRSPILRDGGSSVEPLASEDVETLKSIAGLILYEDSQGFVYATLFDTKEELETSWNAVCAEIAAETEEEEAA